MLEVPRTNNAPGDQRLFSGGRLLFAPAVVRLAFQQIGNGGPFFAQLIDGGGDFLAGEVVVLDPLHNLPGLAIGRQREAADQAGLNPVAAIAADRRTEPLVGRRGEVNALEVVDHRVGRRRRAGRPPGP